MSKKIVRVMVFYDDGTFDEVKAEKQSTLTYPPGVRSPEFPQSEKFVPSPNIPTPWTNPVDYKSCSKCGLKLDGVMGYVCTQPHCPTGLGGAWCGDNV